MYITAIKSSILVFLILTTGFANGQFTKAVIDASTAKKNKVLLHYNKSSKQLTELYGEAEHKTINNWNMSVKHLGIKHKLPKEILNIKREKTEAKFDNLKKLQVKKKESGNSNIVTPLVGINFAGNWYDGSYPPDNSIAISNGGIIVSTVNSNIEYYNTSGTLLYSSSFYDFFNDINLTSTIYDPVVLYDSGSDRFFMVMLHGSSSATSTVITCFSKTNNPNDGWWVYKLTGNPLNDNTWIDYPKIGVSNNEVYISGNLFYDSTNASQQSIIYQIQKTNGYSGSALSWQFWSAITSNPFTLVPASYGHQGNYGPGMYFISTYENGTADKLRLLDLTDDMVGSPVLDVYSMDADFSLAGNAFQAGSSVELNTGDNRGLSAFYLNGIIHFVFHSEYINNYSGINYNRISISTLTNSSKKFGLNGYDYSYPALASFSTSVSDQSVLICFLRSSNAIYPEFRVVSCDNAMNWSTSTGVKSGITYADNGNVSETRWGDYSGICRKQNASNEVWVGGQYGTTRNITGIGLSNCFETWIAQILPGATGLSKNIIRNENEALIFPNPIYNIFNMEFSLADKMNIEIHISDINGKLVRLLYKDVAQKGRNLLSFNKKALGKGIYFVIIKSGRKIIENEKIIVQ